MSKRIVLFGDSHIYAIEAALRARRGGDDRVAFEVYRRLKSAVADQDREVGARKLLPWVRETLRKLVGGTKETSRDIGDGGVTLEEFQSYARELGPDDMLVSVVGGNQHAVFSTIQHPQPFDFLPPDSLTKRINQGAELIPFRTLCSFFSSAIRRGDGEKIASLRRSTRARILHLMAPPPKADNSYIENYHDTQFAKRGIANLGVSSPALRMKFWKLQNKVVNEICGELGVELVEPPAAACDEAGFLERHYYAGDATHANIAYGELVLQQLEQRSSEAPRN